jgi:hypothetical protein
MPTGTGRGPSEGIVRAFWFDLQTHRFPRHQKTLPGTASQCPSHATGIPRTLAHTGHEFLLREAIGAVRQASGCRHQPDSGLSPAVGRGCMNDLRDIPALVSGGILRIDLR